MTEVGAMAARVTVGATQRHPSQLKQKCILAWQECDDSSQVLCEPAMLIVCRVKWKAPDR